MRHPCFRLGGSLSVVHLANSQFRGVMLVVYSTFLGFFFSIKPRLVNQQNKCLSRAFGLINSLSL